MPSPELSEKSRAILEAIAEGHSYEQILSTRIAHTYNDIFHAAAEALDIAHQFKPGRTYEERKRGQKKGSNNGQWRASLLCYRKRCQDLCAFNFPEPFTTS